MTATRPASRLGLIAGAGGLPSAAARTLSAAGHDVVGVGFEGLTDRSLETVVGSMRWLRLGQLGRLVAALGELAAARWLMVGQVPKSLLFDGAGAVDPDAQALELLAALRDRGDDALLAALAKFLERQGFALCGQDEVLAGWCAPRGPLTRRAPDDQACLDLELGLPVLRALGVVGVGQCVVMKHGAALALEAVEGTDATIRRGGRLGGPGATVLKGARPAQDRRFDLPVVGPGTIDALAESGARTLFVEAGSVLLLERETLLARADRADVAVCGFGPDGSPS